MRVLKWPFGYRAGFSISNDAEYLTLSGWIALESMFKTIFGVHGLFSTSIFLINPNKEDPAMTLFNIDGSSSKNYELLSEKIRVTRTIDGVHAIGNFDYDDFRTFPIHEIVDRAANDFHFSWWSNHGSKNNRQNIGSLQLQSYQEGDITGSPYYSVNLAKNLGIEFFWLDNNVIYEKDLKKNIELLRDEMIRDSSLITTFNRFRGLEGKYAPTLESIHEQIRIGMLKKMIRKESGIILYQHLGISSRSGKSIRSIVESEQDIPDSAILFFEGLQKLRSKGLWIAKTSVFLQYLNARRHLSVIARGDSLILSSRSPNKLSLDYISILTCFEVREVKFHYIYEFHGNSIAFKCIKIGKKKFVTVLGKTDE